MASWMIHLRVAEKLIDRLKIEYAREFIVGNIAPDSGEPNENGIGFTPSAEVSHFNRTNPNEIKDVDEQKYIKLYFTKEQQAGYTKAEQEFYLGYLTHLLTDKLWVRDIVVPASVQFKELFEQDRGTFWQNIKRDWYDLDALYLKEHPEFRVFQLYRECVGFQNRYLDFFSKDAFDNRRRYIVDFYLKNSQSVEERELYLTRQELDVFVERAAEEIGEEVKRYVL